ncbi:glutathione S-transferase family protein [Pseudoduganella sp. UC29_71]|uniref:glutathione S-transferase family protein n=1 Tax=Pseudoduganella sp. UC29_71 TaxID=3350174 RepID=UPI003670D9EF
MKLYGDPGSGSTRRVLAALYHIGAEFDFEQIDLFKGDNRTPEFLALNPNGTIPVLVDGGTVLFEASAINFHLAEKFRSDLLPAVVHAGFMETDINAHMRDAIKPLLRNLCIKRFGRLDEVIAPILFLAGPAASYITGTIIDADGGYNV